MTDAVAEAASAGIEGPTIAFTAGRRPETTTLVRLPAFDGPLGLLLALIESDRLDVLSVPLGALATAYLEALAELEDDRIGNVSAFVAVASQLILIKSRALLPRSTAAPETGADADGELAAGTDPEVDLRSRLIVYRAFRDAGAVLATMAAAGRLVHREPIRARAAAVAGAEPGRGERLDPAALADRLVELVRITPPAPGPAVPLRRSVSIAERTEVLRAILRDAGSVVLQDVLREVHDRVVAVVTFLALLELVKRREVTIDQAVPWGPIVAVSTGASR